MAEKKLSEELRFCIEQDGCSKCSCFETQSKLTCPSLLQKAYEVVKRYEEMFPCKVGDIVYEIFDGAVLKRIVRGILLRDGKVFAQDGNGSILGEFYKTVFLTKEAAEKALKEMEDRKNGGISRWVFPETAEKCIEYMQTYINSEPPRKLESEEKSMLHNVTVKVEENKVLETYWTIRGGIKGNSLLRPYHELDHEPTPEEIAQFIYRNKVDFAFVEKDYRFENELPFC